MLKTSYQDIISLANLLQAWQEFVKGKRHRRDVQEFQLHLMDNILDLHEELKNKTYIHGEYQAFNISDPKPRNIHKATVRDRLLHHAVYRQLYPLFDTRFIADSFSCRKLKGAHRALNRFREFGRKVSQNNTKTTWVLKCDIKKFFASIDQDRLFEIIKKHLNDQEVLWLLEKIISSFSSITKDKGLPLGNLTSQLLVNIYMNEFDQFVKHRLKMKYYIRYADDFVILHQNRDCLLELIPKVVNFLDQELKLTIHPNKLFVKTFFSGVDFLGWVHFKAHRVLRTITKRRMFRRIKETVGQRETIQSYLGLLNHGNGYKLSQQIKTIC